MVKVISNLAEFNELINGDKPVVVDYWATWCGPCKMISPHFTKLEATNPDVIFAKVDVEEAEDVAQEVGIKTMPTFHVYFKGAKIDEFSGALPPKLTALIQGAPAKAAAIAESSA